MTDPPASAPPLDSASRRLDSWKEIASYLKRDISTVQRWEKREAMPVHRHLHDKLGSVYAFTAELDAWWQSRRLQLRGTDGAAEVELESSVEAAPRRVRRRAVWVTAAIAVLALTVAQIWSGRRSAPLPQNPLSEARFVRLTDFEGIEEAAAISRDGKFVAFLADRSGAADVWVTQVGSGQFHNLTGGRVGELVNRDVRTIGFSPDATLVTLWVGRDTTAEPPGISVWAVPTLGGEPRPYFEGVVELDWSSDGARLVYHTATPGDPMFVRDDTGLAARPIFTAPAGLHAHFPLWAPDDESIFFVYGGVPDQLDIWRIAPAGGEPERVTSHNSRVSHPTFLDRRTLLYLANDSHGAGPWLYALDLGSRKTRRISFGVERYTSLAASADGRRLVVTVANPKRTLWRVPIADDAVSESAATRVTVPTAGARAPRIGPGYLLYVSSGSDGEGIWKLAEGKATELWNVKGGRVVGGPGISPGDGRRIAFSVEERGRTRMYLMNSDGSALRVLPEALQPRGTPAWAPDGQSIAVTAILDGKACVAKVSADGRTFTPLVSGFAAEPAWSPNGASLFYSGPDVGTTFQIQAVSADGRLRSEPNEITLRRGARRLAFLPERNAMVVLRGDLNHKNFSLIDLRDGRERPLTNFPRDWIVTDFDVSPDGSEIIFGREHDSSDVVLIDR